MEDEQKPGLACRGLPDGQVQVIFYKERKPVEIVDITIEAAMKFTALLLSAVTQASLASGYKPGSSGAGASLAGQPCFRPTSIGLSAGAPPEPMSFVIHAGKGRLGIALEGKAPRELGQALLAASAPQETPH